MKKLYRSRRDSKLFGLCGGLAEMLNVDATLLRLIVVISAVFSGGTVVLLYIVASMVIPKEPVYEPSFGFGSMQPPYTPPYYGSGAARVYAEPVVPPVSHMPPDRAVPPMRQAPAAAPQPQIDDMMKDIEKKALLKEIEELRAKLAKIEKGE